jgi:hypothetical protein
MGISDAISSMADLFKSIIERIWPEKSSVPDDYGRMSRRAKDEVAQYRAQLRVQMLKDSVTVDYIDRYEWKAKREREIDELVEKKKAEIMAAQMELYKQKHGNG